VRDYDNLLYACAACTLAKGDAEVPDPCACLLDGQVTVDEHGRIHGQTPDASLASWGWMRRTIANSVGCGSILSNLRPNTTLCSSANSCTILTIFRTSASYGRHTIRALKVCARVFGLDATGGNCQKLTDVSAHTWPYSCERCTEILS